MRLGFKLKVYKGGTRMPVLYRNGKTRPKTVPEFHLRVCLHSDYYRTFRFHNVELEGNVAPISAGLRDHLEGITL